MNVLKISSISFFVLFSLILSTPVFAVETPTPTPATPSGSAVIVADVNLYNAKIVSQKDNVINLSFDIANKEGVQAGVKYSVKLISETKNGQFSVDEYIYPEVLSLSANTKITKEITYTAPANLNGVYTVLLNIKNESSLPLGLGVAGKVNLVSTSKTAEILTDSCYLSVAGEKGSPKYVLNQGVDIAPTENLVINCTVVNSSKVSVSAIPTYETHYRTMYGEVVAQEGGDVAPLSLKAGEKKVVSLVLPKATKPQAYDVKFSLTSGDVTSNSVVVHYVIQGSSATIQNLSLDKDYYNKNDIAKISFLLSSSADGFPGSRAGKGSVVPETTLVANIFNDKNKECIAPISQIVKDTITDISTTILADCNNPKASIELKDANGNILASKNLSFESKSKNEEPKEKEVPSDKNGSIIFIAFGSIVIAGLAVYFIRLRRKDYLENNLNKSNETDIK